METRIDFLQCLQVDMVLKILASLDDPSDLIRASAVSRSWHHFVISNRICKKLCLQMFRQLSSVACVTVSNSTRNSADAECNKTSEWETLEKEHRTFAFLGRALTKLTASDCIADTISASSTDNYPEESIRNTLDPRDKVFRRASYWSSKGKSDPGVPETLIYKLLANLCVISEFQIQPFQAYFQPHFPIYSAKFVRFRMGHPKSPRDIENDLRDLPLQIPADDKFIWTYTSPMFPMFQENSLQKFKLPEPVLCIGGYLQIELLGRVQKQEMDGLYYICVSHVKALGQSLFPAFDAEIVEPFGKFLLKYFPENQNQPPPTSHYSGLGASTDMLQANLRGLEQLLNMLQGNAPDVDLYEWDDDDNDNDIDFVVM